MLDNITKRKIDNARNILVGRIPDPKSQIQQITLALIYKFMNDTDKQSIKLGGKASYFIGDYEKYSWDNLMDTRLSGQERTNLYMEGLDSMKRNPHLPELFRQIFKEAYLPFRDYSTINMFLEEINGFEYDHSERLGDAYEYLLSIMSSQGDAGQFRTPRHIIDFIVEIVEPQKTDRILDPACGTAGFLISALKYIYKNNTKEVEGDLLNSDELKRLADNVDGYDISPDMVQISLVNMFLHKITQPHIYDYDTLSSLLKWDENYSCILANPPFMSPKGGIIPHNRFSIQSKRSEVLFVDYMMEHLTTDGKAGIIVPEGIIFQSSNAYVELRRKLIEESYLWAVVSLPAGVFNPYSGVKTSILLLDRKIAIQTDKILFIKVNNDGFGLGAQRKPIETNDLPDAFNNALAWKKAALSQSEYKPADKNVIVVEKTRLAESGDYNLSGERYNTSNIILSEFPLVELSSLCSIKTGKKDVNQGNPNGIYPFFTCAKECTFSDEYSFDCEALLIAGNGVVGDVKYYNGKFEAYQRTYVLSDFVKLKPNYLYFILKDKLPIYLQELKQGNTMPYIKLGMLAELQIPLPPLSVQEEIVAELDSYQKIIDGARQVVDNYKPHIEIDPKWNIMKIQDIAHINPNTSVPNDLYSDWFTYVDISSIDNTSNNLNSDNRINVSDAPSRARRQVIKNDTIISTVRPNLKAFYFFETVPERAIASTGFAVLRPKDKLVPKYLFYVMFTDFVLSQMISRMGKGAYPSINQTDVSLLNIPLPDLYTQQAIVDRIEQEQKLVEGNRQLIKLCEQKIKDRIAKIWSAE